MRRRHGLLAAARRSPWGMCSTCGLDFPVSKLHYVMRFGRWQCPDCDDSGSPPDAPRVPNHPYEAVRTTAAPAVDEYKG